MAASYPAHNLHCKMRRSQYSIRPGTGSWTVSNQRVLSELYPSAANHSRLASAVEVDKRNTQFGVVGLAQLGGRLADDHLERRPHVAAQQVPAPGAAVGQAEDGVQVQCGPSAPTATSPSSDSTSHCSSTLIGWYFRADRSNQPTVARSNAPTAVTCARRDRKRRAAAAELKPVRAGPGVAGRCMPPGPWQPSSTRHQTRTQTAVSGIWSRLPGHRHRSRGLAAWPLGRRASRQESDDTRGARGSETCEGRRDEH